MNVIFPSPGTFGNCIVKEVGDKNSRYLKEVCYYKNDDTPFYKCPNSEEYYSVQFMNGDTCWLVFYDKICPLDPGFFQACGHAGCSTGKGANVVGERELLCSTYLCGRKEGHMVFRSGKELDVEHMCNGKEDCVNTDIDEQGTCEFEESFQCTDFSKMQIDANKVCDLQCDCWNCEDEGFCNDVTYGVFCEAGQDGDYVPAAYVCDNARKHCIVGQDEDNCDENVVRTCQLSENNKWYEFFKEGRRPISQSQMCAVPREEGVCSDGLDQVNCSDTTRVALTCAVKSFQTTISVFGICQDHFLCDDGYDSNCVQPEGGCIIHKNQLCDNHQNCAGHQDEENYICQQLTNVSCIRRLSFNNEVSALPLPFEWIFDGISDCINNEDEDEQYWRKCEFGETVRFIEKGSECNDMLKCSDKTGFIEFPDICDKINSCGRELEICEKSRGIVETYNNAFVVEEPRQGHSTRLKALTHCLRGIEELSAQAGGCKKKTVFEVPGGSSNYATESYLILPNTSVSCLGMFGENYVYMSCSHSCLEATCPVKPIPQDTCTNKEQEKVYSLVSTNKLQVLLRQQTGLYTDKIFPCDNKNCVMYDQVCNLVDDCGDASDEKHCTNHFFCASSNEYIPSSSKCDGFYDCRYFDDECNEECNPSNRFILRNNGLKVSTWVTGGLAVLFNLFTTVRSLLKIRKTKTYGGMMNRVLILLVSLGDLMMGLYLIAIAVVDVYQGHHYCKKKFQWLASNECAVLGALNTMASQLSLFSMTVLSVFRISTIGSMVQRGLDGLKPKLKILALTAIIIIFSLLVAVMPVARSFENFFVNGLYYEENPLFTASVTKKTHREIFSEHYGRSRQNSYFSWSMIRDLVRGMFTDDYGGENKYFFEIKFIGLSQLYVPSLFEMMFEREESTLIDEIE